jgi:hypothetical protein
MAKQLLAPEVHIRVEVDISPEGVTFTYITADGMQCNGDVDVTEQNTAVCYVLVNSDDLIFAAPIVDIAKAPEDLIFMISPDQRTLIINDSDLVNQTVSFRLVVVKRSDTTTPYISNDPIIRSIPN